ncbi:MAG TPA: oxygen-independent coproporphyrinogen III oxidase [Xanthobacteraceae bacterium]
MNPSPPIAAASSREAHVLAEQNVPRYTSYPTAPHFNKDIAADAYGAWLAQVPEREPLSLYLHVPFCRNLCLYCGCHTKAIRRQEPIDAYAASLICEIALVAARTGYRKVSHLHWGGGTPSILSGNNLSDIVGALDAAFDLGAIREHAIELDPRYIDGTLVRVLADMGVNRASLGVQDFSPHVQRAIGRIQSYEDVARAAGLLRDGGIVNLNFDLMYGLPRQSVDDVCRSAAQAVTLAPQRIALFGYAHVPWFRSQQRLIDAASLAGPAERLAQMSAAREVFLAAGYAPIGFDHFALPTDELALAAGQGRLRRNFQGYTVDDAGTLIGLGASAIGRAPQGFVQNAPDVAGYQRAVSGGRLAAVRGLAFSRDDHVRGRIIEALMCDFTADPRAIAAQFGVDEGFDDELGSLAPLAAQGIVTTSGDRVVVTESGRPFVRLVAAAFDSYLAGSAQRHSVAV